VDMSSWRSCEVLMRMIRKLRNESGKHRFIVISMHNLPRAWRTAADFLQWMPSLRNETFIGTKSEEIRGNLPLICRDVHPRKSTFWEFPISEYHPELTIVTGFLRLSSGGFMDESRRMVINRLLSHWAAFRTNFWCQAIEN
jgi:hypothetical protein